MLQTRTRKPGVLGKTYDRIGNAADNSLAVVDHGTNALAIGTSSLVPMAGELVNNSKADLVESIVNLGLVRKNAMLTLTEAGYTDLEIAEMLAPTRH